MGLFDFVSDIGKKVFSKEEDASKAVTQHIAEDNPGVENLSVTVENGVANIQGVASTAAALEKAVLMAGNIQGIHSVTSDASINNGETLGSDETFYVIQKGDTLWKIAEKAYGNGAKYTAIVEANKEVIKDADKIFPHFFLYLKLLINCAILAGFPVNFPVSIDCLIFFRYNLAVFYFYKQ